MGVPSKTTQIYCMMGLKWVCLKMKMGNPANSHIPMRKMMLYTFFFSAVLYFKTNPCSR